MFFRHFLIDYFNGLRASFLGFLVLHKLDGAVEDEKAKLGELPAQKTEQLTELARRRRALASSMPKPTIEELAPQRATAVKRVLQCMLLNVACVIALQLVLVPLFRLVAYLLPWRLPDGWTAEIVSSLVGVVSILPVFIVTRVVNALWFADIASASLKFRGVKPVPPLSLSRAAADFVVAILVEAVFVIQSILMVHLPIPLIAPLINFFHLSLLHALYSFEYFWMSQGKELKRRLATIERCWPYFLGFGTTLTLLTTVSENFVVNGCLFGMFFPFFIISSYMADIKVVSEDSPSVPTVHIFWPSLIVTNRISAYISRLAAVPQIAQTVPPHRRPFPSTRLFDRSASPPGQQSLRQALHARHTRRSTD